MKNGQSYFEVIQLGLSDFMSNCDPTKAQFMHKNAEAMAMNVEMVDLCNP